jgi:hypothetical protein
MPYTRDEHYTIQMPIDEHYTIQMPIDEHYTIQMPIFTLFAIILFNVLSILKTSCQEYVIILIISVLLQCTIMIINYIYKKIT